MNESGDSVGTTELAEQANRSVSVSTIYVTLMRLEEKGYVGLMPW